MMSRRRNILILLLGVAACESDVAKLQRLDTDRAIACLGVLAAEQKRDSVITALGDSPYVTDTLDGKEPERAEVTALRAEVLRRKAECELATRAYNKFKQ